MSPILSRNRLVDLGCIAILLSVALAIALPRYRTQIDWGDEGFLAYGAVRVMDGQMPHRDFVSLQPPLSFYTVAAAFKIGGASLATLRSFGLLIYVAISLLIYALARSLTKPGFALAAALPATVLGMPEFNFVPFAVWQGIAASLAAAILFLRSIQTSRRSLAVAAGLLNATSIFLRHDQGLYLAISIAILTISLALAKDPSFPAQLAKRMFVMWLAGLSGMMLALVLYCWWRGALPEMFRQLVVFPLTRYGETSSLPFPQFNSQNGFRLNALAALFYLPPIVMLIAAACIVYRIVRRTFDSKNAFFIFFITWAALFYCQVLTRSDKNHLFIALPPLLILTALGWESFLRVSFAGRSVRIFLSITMAMIAAVYLWTIYPFVMAMPAKDLEIVDLARGGVRIDKGEWVTTFIRGVQDYVPPDRAILSLPYEPMFYFLCARHNPTRWNYLWPGDQTPADHAAFIAQAQKDPPAVVFITKENEFAKSAPNIIDYVHNEFRHAADFDRLSVYFPRDATR